MSEKPDARVIDRPVGYSVAIPHKRMTRPVHSRKAILEQAEAAFKPKPVAESGNPESKR